MSRTFTPGAYVSPETRRKVLRAAEALGYQPNALARGLIKRRTGIVGIVSTDLDNPFYATLLQSLGERLQAEGLAPLLLFGDEHSTDPQIAQLLSYQVDALVMTNATVSSKMAARCAQSERPVIAINRYLPHEDITSITCDNRGSAAAVADHLIGLGCRRIAFVAGIPDASSSRDRETGFLRRLGQAGSAAVAHEIGHYTHDGGVEAARRLLALPAPPDGIFCANDLMAFGVMDAARDAFGLRSRATSRCAASTTRASRAGPPTTSPRSTRTSPQWSRQRRAASSPPSAAGSRARRTSRSRGASSSAPPPTRPQGH